MVDCKETLHRAIKPKPQFWDTKTNRVTSALFKDSHGVSVDRNAGKSDEQIKHEFLSKFSELKGDARLTAGFCFDNFCRVEANPTLNNKHHALILGQTSVELTKGQAKRLAENSTIVIYNDVLSS